MKKMIAYQEQDIGTILSLLNGISVSGVQNCKNIALIAQILDSGAKAEVQEDSDKKKEGVEDGDAVILPANRLAKPPVSEDGAKPNEPVARRERNQRGR